MSRYWIRFIMEEGYEPNNSPPGEGVLAWWCSGFDGSDKPIICALVDAEDDDHAEELIDENWSDYDVKTVDRVDDDFIPTGRFNIEEDWSKERLSLKQ